MVPRMDEVPVERLLRMAHREAAESIQLLRTALRTAPSESVPALLADAVEALGRLEAIELRADLAYGTGPAADAHENARSALWLARKLRAEISRRYPSEPPAPAAP